jgi:hypothetical protein
MLDQAGSGSTGQTGSSHVLSALRLAASVIVLRASSAQSPATRAGTSTRAALTLILVLVAAHGSHTGSHCSGTKAKLHKSLRTRVRVRAAATPAAVTTTAAVSVVAGTVIVMGVGAMAAPALAAVVVTDMSGGIDSHGTQSTRTGCLRSAA